MSDLITPDHDFMAVVQLIESAKQRASRAVNTELIDLYWAVGEYVSQKLGTEAWGKGTVEALADFIQRRQPGLRGFSAKNIWRMRQFYETYRDTPILSTLLRELAWSAHLHILTRSQHPEERAFYLRAATEQRWSVREVARQMDNQLFARTITAPVKMAQALKETRPEASSSFKDSYLEALDRDHKKPHENPAIGLLLCASKDDEVVEYALSRSLSPALVAQYQTQLPDKKLLQAKLHEFYLANVGEGEAE